METEIQYQNNSQGSTEWQQERLGKFTASEMFRLMTDPKTEKAKNAGELSEGALTYILEKIGEDATQQQSSDYVSEAMLWGMENEHLARRLYEKIYGVKIQEMGFVRYGDHAGGSPDGLIGEDGGIEIKCPTTAVHLKHCLIAMQENPQAYFKAKYPKYYYQCQTLMMFTNRKWWDFVSFDKRIKEDYALFVLRVTADTADFQEIDVRIKAASIQKGKMQKTFDAYRLPTNAVPAEITLDSLPY